MSIEHENIECNDSKASNQINYLLRFGEVALKGKNKPFFVDKLVENVKAIAEICSQPITKLQQRKQRSQRKTVFKPKLKVNSFHNYILVRSNTELNLKTVFGIANYSRVFITDFDVTNIKSVLVENLKQFIKSKQNIRPDHENQAKRHKPKNQHKPQKQTTLNQATPNQAASNQVIKSFRITVKRVDKRFPMHSNKLASFLGDVVRKHFRLNVDLSNPDVNVLVELIHGKAFISFEKIKAAGGLPVGVEGSVVVVFGLTSVYRELLAFLTALKRGCYASIGLLPKSYTLNEASQEISENDKILLQKFNPKPLRINVLDNLSVGKSIWDTPLFTGLSFRELQELCSKSMDLKHKLLKHNVFHPLIALSDKEVKQRIENFKRLASI